MTIKQALVLCALAVPAVASAGQWDKWYVTPEVGAISPDYRRGLEHQDWAYGLAFGHELNRYLNLELNLEGGRLSGNQYHLQTHDATLDLLGILNRQGVVAPYIRLGLGAVYDQPSNQSNRTNFGGDAGVGLYVHLWRSADGTSSFSLRPEIKVRWDNQSHFNFGDYIADLGFQYAFGGTPAEAAPAAAPPPPPPPPAAKPAPAPAPAPAAAAPVPAAAPSIVPSRGSVTLKGVTFAFNSARLDSSSDAELDRVASELKAHPLLKVELQGYTDSVGSLKYNMKLSQRRAQAVRQYLIGDGVSAGQLRARGYGPHDPIASNRTAAGRAENRRVVLEVLSNPNAVKVKGQGKIG